MRTSSFITLVALLLLLGACKKEEPAPATAVEEPPPEPVAPEPTPAPEPVVLTTADHVQKTEECWTKFNANEPAFASCFAADASIDLAGTPMRAEGREGVLGVIGGFRAGLPDIKGSQALVLGSGNKVVTIDLMNGTNTAPLMGMPATNQKLGLYVAHVFEKNAAGEVQKEVVFYDEGAFMGQLGVNKAPHRALVEALPAPTVKAIASESPEEQARLATITKTIEFFNAHDAKALADIVHDDFVMSDQTMPADTVGKAANLKGLEAWFGAFPDAKFEQTWAIAAGDYVVREIEFAGTNTAPARSMGIKKPTGKPVSVRALEVFRFEGDKPKHLWWFSNGFDLAVQLGLAKRPEPPAAVVPTEGEAKPAEEPAKPEEG